MDRRPGWSVRLKLTLSYAGFLVVAGVLLLAVVWVFLLRYVPDGAINTTAGFAPNRSDLLRAFAPAISAVLLFLLLLLLGIGGGWFLAGRMLAPLTRIGDATRLAANGSLSHRIDLEGPKDEFRELADAFDTMLARLEAHIAEQQRFAANASHELRTPLAISQTLLDVARKDPERDVGALVDRLQSVNTRAIELTEALLLLSRADRGSFAREVVDLSLVVEEVVETLLPLAERRGVTLEVTTDVARAVGSEALLLPMATNLVQNAIVHNLPDNGHVLVRTEARHGATVLCVENTPAGRSPQTCCRPWPSRFSAALSACTAMTTPVSASAWRSCRASPGPTRGRWSLRQDAPVDSASRCSFPPSSSPDTRAWRRNTGQCPGRVVLLPSLLRIAPRRKHAAQTGPRFASGCCRGGDASVTTSWVAAGRVGRAVTATLAIAARAASPPLWPATAPR